MLPAIALVLIRPNDVPLSEWLFDRLFFGVQPKVAVYGLREMQQEQHEANLIEQWTADQAFQVLRIDLKTI